MTGLQPASNMAQAATAPHDVMMSAVRCLSGIESVLWRPRVLGTVLAAVSAALAATAAFVTPDRVTTLLGSAAFTDARIATVLGGSKYDSSFSAHVVVSTVHDLRMVAAVTGVLGLGLGVTLLSRPAWVSKAWRCLTERLAASRRADRAFLAAVCATTLVAVLTATRNGMGIDPDSTVYIVTGRSLAAGQGFAGFVSWPPGYPLLIAGLVRTGVDPMQAARVVSALTLTGSVVPLYFLGRLAGGRLAGCLCSLGPLLLWPVTLVSVYAWSETPYILFSLLATLFLTLFHQGLYRGSGLWLIGAAAATAAYALLVRYIGVSVIAAGSLVLLFDSRFRGGRRLAHSVGFGLVAAVPMCVWVLHNITTTGTLAGERTAGVEGPLHNAVATLGQVVGDLTSRDAVDTLAPGTGLIIGTLVLALLAAVVLVAVRADTNMALVRRWWAAVVPVAVYTVVYLITLVGIASVWEFLPIYVRFTTPVYPFVAVLFVSFGALMSTRLPDLVSRRAAIVLFTVLILVVASLQFPLTLLVHNGAEQGYSYNSAFWRESPSVAWAEQNMPEGSVVFTNDVFALRLRLPDRDLRWLPERSSDPVEQLKALEELARLPGVFFYVFRDYAAPSEIRQVYGDVGDLSASSDLLVQLADFPEATIWQSKGAP